MEAAQHQQRVKMEREPSSQGLAPEFPTNHQAVNPGRKQGIVQVPSPVLELLLASVVNLEKQVGALSEQVSIYVRTYKLFVAK